MNKYLHHTEVERPCDWCVSYVDDSAGCVDTGFIVIDQKIYEVSLMLSALTKAKERYLEYRYPVNIENVTIENIKTVSSTLNFIHSTLSTELSHKLRGFKGCLSDKELQTVIEKANSWTGGTCNNIRKDITIDTTGLDQWIAKHPRCISYEAWNKWASWMCDNIELDIKIQEERCNIVLDLVTKAIPKELVCDLKLHNTRVVTNNLSGKQCEIEFKLLKKENPKCNLSLTMYKDLISCDFSLSLIKKVYACDLKFIKAKNDWKLSCPSGDYSVSDFNQNINLEMLYSVVTD